MARRTAEERVEKYMSVAFHGRKPSAKLAAIKARTYAAFRRLVDVDAGVRKVLWNEPVCSTDYWKYLTFARQLSKALRVAGGLFIPESAKRNLVEKYKGWGCAEAILEKILAEVFWTKIKEAPTASDQGPAQGRDGGGNAETAGQDTNRP